MKRRLLSLFLLLTLLLTLVGCGADTVKDTTTASTTVTKTSTSASAAVSTETTTLPTVGTEDTTISATEESGGDTTAPVIIPTEGDTTAPTEGVSSTVTHTTVRPSVTVPSVSQAPSAAVSTESNTTATVTTATPHPSHNVATTTTTKATTLSSTKPTKPTKPSTTAAITTTTGTTAVTTIPTTTAPTTVAPTTQTTTATTAAPTTTASTAVSADKLLVDRAFQLGVGQKIENVTLTGVVTSSNGYSAGYNNATFDLQVEGTGGAKTLYCYRVKPADTSRPEVAVGDRLSLSGTIQNYKGTIEFYPATYTHLGGGGTTATTTATTRPTGGSATIDEDGIYDSKEDVGLYIHLYGKLPKNYVTKSQYNKDRYLCVGGDRFYNKEGRLPGGETYYECDIDTYGSTSRGAKRLVWTKSGIVYYTGDHYETFIQLYGER